MRVDMRNTEAVTVLDLVELQESNVRIDLGTVLDHVESDLDPLRFHERFCDFHLVHSGDQGVFYIKDHDEWGSVINLGAWAVPLNATVGICHD